MLCHSEKEKTNPRRDGPEHEKESPIRHRKEKVKAYKKNSSRRRHAASVS